MKRLLIANRGEIALRIARTAREMGIESVGVFSPEDTELARGIGCDALVALEARGAAAYLDIDALVGAAKSANCDALHPGYGFQSENPELAKACAAAGIVFVGPSPETLHAFGDKSRARALAEQVDVAIVPGIESPATIEQARAFFQRESERGSERPSILLKAAAGGGGRGMRVVRSPEELEEAYVRCASEANRAFGSEALFAERMIDPARHVEIQIVADAHGTILALGERDCTLQRRHQKLVEIAPAPGLAPELARTLSEAACRLARSAGYTGIGTFEFLLDDADRFFFIEANPRLQVEHTVTEEVAGIDLVETQIRIARGEKLAEMGMGEVPESRGHAIQLRILAETLDASGAPRPSDGTLDVFEAPSGPGVRLDSAMRRGLAPSPAFDPLIAKLVVSSRDADFTRVVEKARRALAEFRIEGLDTNLPLLRALLERSELRSAALDTRFVERNAEALHASALVFERASRPGAVEGGADSATSSPAAQTDAAAEAVPDGLLAIRAPLLGTVIEVHAAEEDEVSSGQPLCVLESMKMEHVITAPAAGRIGRGLVEVGDVVREEAPLFWLEASGQDLAFDDASEASDPNRIRPDLQDVLDRHALLQDAARPEAVKRRRDRGQRTARENLAALCDPDSFVEYGGLAVAAQRRARPLDELQKRTPADAIITGFGTVNADRFGASVGRCAVLVADATVLAGTQGYFHHHKIDRILELAEKHSAPVVFYPEGGGGRPNDTDVGDISTAGLNVTSFHAFARLSGKVPRVSVVSGFCFAGSAAFAGCADVIIATRGTSLGMGGPAMIEGGGLGVHAPEDVGPVSVQEPNGVIDVLVENEEEAATVARRYLAYFQGRESDWECPDQMRLRHLIPENRRRIYDIRSVIETLCDEGSVLELRRAFGVGMITALVRIEGHAFGLIANDPMHLGGAIDDVGSEKAARFLQLCDAFGLPVLSLCDTPGFMVGPEIEERAQVRKVSRLFVTGASLTVPVFMVILRKGYGLGAQAMAGGSFVTPTLNVAWPTGEIGGMGLEGAVDLGFKKSLDAQPTEAERTALREKLIAALYEKGKALNGASQLEFDGVIDPAQTRETLLRAFNAVGPIGPGSRRMIDTW